jgi:hypothetical protein
LQSFEIGFAQTSNSCNASETLKRKAVLRMLSIGCERRLLHADLRIQSKAHCYNSAPMNFPSRVRVFFIVRTVWGWSQKKASQLAALSFQPKRNLLRYGFLLRADS